MEEALSRLDIRTSNVNALRNILLSAASHTDIDNQELFASYIQSQLQYKGLSSEEFLETLKLPYQETLTDHDATLLWNETISVYEIAHLEYEFKELQERISQSMNEDDYNRMLELQNAVQQARARRSFAPTESDVA